jgi:multidrug efflux pump subunit AcrB
VAFIFDPPWFWPSPLRVKNGIIKNIACGVWFYTDFGPLSWLVAFIFDPLLILTLLLGGQNCHHQKYSMWGMVLYWFWSINDFSQFRDGGQTDMIKNIASGYVLYVNWILIFIIVSLWSFSFTLVKIFDSTDCRYLKYNGWFC